MATFREHVIRHGLVSAAAAILLCSAWLAAATASRRAVPMQFPSADAMEEMLFLAGVTPESLAAAQVQPAQVGPLVQAGIGQLVENFDTLATAKGNHDAARADAESLGRLVRAGLATQNDMAAHAAAVALETSAGDALEQALDGVLASFVEALLNSDGQGLLTAAANRARGLPMQYLVVDRSPSEWVALRDALADVRISNTLGLDPDPVSVQIVLQANADPAVVAAKVGLESLPLVQEAWKQAIEHETGR